VKVLAWTIMVATLAGAGGYTVVYLFRWEWHRALLAGVLFLAAELAIATAVLLRAVNRPARTTPAADPAPERLLQHIERARPTRDHFAWLRSHDRMAVFIPILLGAGVLVSAVAFIIERLATSTAQPGMERALARDLAGIAFPPGGLVADEAELAAQDAPYADDAELRVLLAPLHRGR
jgi:hypothetical protein